MKLIRVAYGKKDTPAEDREYRINGVGPVGSIKEICAHFELERSDLEIWERCPKCNEVMEPGMEALSREDNETKICSFCGTKEALKAFKAFSNKSWKLCPGCKLAYDPNNTASKICSFCGTQVEVNKND